MRVALIVMVLTACDTAPEPAAHPVVTGSAVERNAACEGCHIEVAREWRDSLHMQSYSDPVYQRSFALEPLAFCTRCHAPEATAEAPAPPHTTIGTACVTCHTGGPSGLAARACAECHEFGFPEGPGLMQLTATEHRASSKSKTTCVACHMSRASGHANHRFAASRDADFLRSAADFDATRAPDEVVIRLRPRDVGHALPTGDIFRRLRVEASVLDEPTTGRHVFLSRNTKTNGPDNRPFLTGAPAEVRLDVTAPGRVITWRVVYERVEHPTAPDGSNAVIEGAVELASGTLPP